MTEQLTPELWKYAITIIAIIFGLLIVCAATVATVYFIKSPKEATIHSNEFFKSQSAVRLLAVLVVVGAASILSLFNSLNEGAIAILSGITGYVLGGLPAATNSGSTASGTQQNPNNSLNPGRA